ncbi:MAG: inorganic pyrophosphatase [Thermoanaerobaculia bacterium]|nr:inorganic pyrophosphatase [Thermoanaerobaculia bacterium]
MSFPKPFYRWRPHPWHGLDAGPEPPRIVNAYIEITPFDSVKFEVDKTTGYLRVDRPQRSSSVPPALYGFIPRTYCGRRVGALSPGARRGDGDPMDISVFSERAIGRSEILLTAKVIGGLQFVDDEEADDKIIAVLQNDYSLGRAEEIGDLPGILVERLQHYFETYKMVPGRTPSVSVEKVYGAEHALRVVQASIADYQEEYPD